MSWLAKYQQALLNDLTALCQLHHLPCQMVSQEQVVFIADNQQLTEQLGQLQQALQHLQITQVKFEVLADKQVAEQHQQLSVMWQFLDEQNQVQLDFCTTYLLYQDKILSVVSHERDQAPAA